MFKLKARKLEKKRERENYIYLVKYVASTNLIAWGSFGVCAFYFAGFRLLQI